MTEKQKIEVGQVWRIRAGNNYGTVVGVSPAWIKLDDDVEVRNFRRGDFLNNWFTVDEAMTEVETPADPEVMPDYTPGERDNMTLTMSNAIEAFNSLTGHNIPVADGFLLLHAISVIVGRKDSGKCMDMVAMDVDFNALYEESR